MESKEEFDRRFKSRVATLQEQISALDGVANVGGERQDAVENVLSGISRLSNEVADAADYVPAYDQRAYSEAIKALKERLEETTAKWRPKARFQFKPRTANAGGGSKPDARRLNPMPNTNTAAAGDAGSSSSAPAAAEGVQKQSSTPGPRNIALSDFHRVHIIHPPPPATADVSTCTLTDVQRSVIDMSAQPNSSRRGSFASLTLKNIAGSVILAGRIDGPAHITGVRDSVVMVIARQVRIHECENVSFYLHCVSRPIIEDCKGVRFARAPEAYLTEKEKNETNLWDQVDDFKWLKTTASPNWSLVPESELISEEAWEMTRPGNFAVGVDDILRSLKVAKGS
ncbi:hypothetical protein VTK56DRAFT_1401 [Thermocarpiscus australiensis]